MLKRLLAALLPDSKPPKLPAKEQVVPKYLTGAKGATVSNTVNNITNLALGTDVRNEATMNQVIKKLVLTSPDLANAVVTKINTAITANYTAIAYDELGRVDQKGTELVQAFVRKLDAASYDYTKFTRSTDLRSLCSTLLLDNLRYGAMSFEVVLGQGRVPSHFKPIACRLLEWANDTPATYPVYNGPDGKVPLNYPTIIYSATLQDGETAYSDSPMQAAVQACIWDMEFVDILRRAATNNMLSRLVVTIKSEKYIQTLPMEVQSDAAAMERHMSDTIARLEAQMSQLSPEDSLVLFDTLEVDTIQDKNRSEDRSIDVLQKIINGKISSGAKILPSVIGRGESSSAASSESMLYLKQISSVQQELNTMLSRAFTLVARIMNNPVTVVFKFQETNLRPDLELASFKAIEQSSILEKLSLGFIDDTEASIMLTGTIPPAGFKPLSGTQFYGKAALPEGGNDYSNTSVSPDGKPDSTKTQKDSDPDRKGVKSK